MLDVTPDKQWGENTVVSAVLRDSHLWRQGTGEVVVGSRDDDVMTPAPAISNEYVPQHGGRYLYGPPPVRPDPTVNSLRYDQ